MRKTRPVNSDMATMEESTKSSATKRVKKTVAQHTDSVCSKQTVHQLQTIWLLQAMLKYFDSPEILRCFSLLSKWHNTEIKGNQLKQVTNDIIIREFGNKLIETHEPAKQALQIPDNVQKITLFYNYFMSPKQAKAMSNDKFQEFWEIFFRFSEYPSYTFDYYLSKLVKQDKNQQNNVTFSVCKCLLLYTVEQDSDSKMYPSAKSNDIINRYKAINKFLPSNMQDFVADTGTKNELIIASRFLNHESFVKYKYSLQTDSAKNDIGFGSEQMNILYEAKLNWIKLEVIFERILTNTLDLCQQFAPTTDNIGKWTTLLLALMRSWTLNGHIHSPMLRTYFVYSLLSKHIQICSIIIQTYPKKQHIRATISSIIALWRQSKTMVNVNLNVSQDDHNIDKHFVKFTQSVKPIYLTQWQQTQFQALTAMSGKI